MKKNTLYIMCIVCSHCIHTVYCDVYKVTKNNETFWQLLTLLPILLSSSWAPSPPSEAASSSAPKHLKGCWKLCMIMWQEQLPQCSSSSILSWRRSGKLWELCRNKFQQEIRETFTAFLKTLTSPWNLYLSIEKCSLSICLHDRVWKFNFHWFGIMLLF